MLSFTASCCWCRRSSHPSIHPSIYSLTVRDGFQGVVSNTSYLFSILIKHILYCWPHRCVDAWSETILVVEKEESNVVDRNETYSVARTSLMSSHHITLQTVSFQPLILVKCKELSWRSEMSRKAGAKHAYRYSELPLSIDRISRRTVLKKEILWITIIEGTKMRRHLTKYGHSWMSE